MEMETSWRSLKDQRQHLVLHRGNLDREMVPVATYLPGGSLLKEKGQQVQLNQQFDSPSNESSA